MTLTMGDKAPEFKLQSDQNESIALKDFRGKKVILYFYPKDDTPGCTKEACDFRDMFSTFSKQGAVILGVSKDSPERHQKFKTKYQLPFTLLADVKGDVCEQYGVLNKKSLFGKTFLGIQRMTFLIDEKGMIEKIWPKVKVKGHVEAVLEEV